MDGSDDSHASGDTCSHASALDEGKQCRLCPIGEGPCVEHSYEPCDAKTFEGFALVSEEDCRAVVDALILQGFAEGCHGLGCRPEDFLP